MYGWPVAKDARIDVMSANNRYVRVVYSYRLLFLSCLLSVTLVLDWIRLDWIVLN